MNIKKKEVEFAKTLIGKKVALLGGGQLANAFKVVIVKGVNEETGQAILDVGNGNEFTPYLMSWYLRNLNRALEDLSIGAYYYSPCHDMDGNITIRNQSSGIFGTIYDCKIEKVVSIEELLNGI